MTDPPAWFETLTSQVVYDRGFGRVRIDRVAMPDGTQADREVVEHADAVAVLPVFDDGTVLLLRQYRHPFGSYQLEIPAGKLDLDDEDPATAANRELVEETGQRAGTLRHLVTVRNSAGWCTERTHVFLGTDLAPAPAPEGFVRRAEEADMEIIRLPIPAALAAVRAGDLPDAKTALALLFLATETVVEA